MKEARVRKTSTDENNRPDSTAGLRRRTLPPDNSFNPQSSDELHNRSNPESRTFRQPLDVRLQIICTHSRDLDLYGYASRNSSTCNDSVGMPVVTLGL